MALSLSRRAALLWGPLAVLAFGFVLAVVLPPWPSVTAQQTPLRKNIDLLSDQELAAFEHAIRR